MHGMLTCYAVSILPVCYFTCFTWCILPPSLERPCCLRSLSARIEPCETWLQALIFAEDLVSVAYVSRSGGAARSSGTARSVGGASRSRTCLMAGQQGFIIFSLATLRFFSVCGVWTAFVGQPLFLPGSSAPPAGCCSSALRVPAATAAVVPA